MPESISQKYNNPFALIDPTPDNWRGLTGMLSNGFLQFDTLKNGLRAGLINLKNVYFKPHGGVTTTKQLTPVYVGTPWGKTSKFGDNPITYADSILKYTGIGHDTPIRWNDKKQIVALARAIIQVEAGKLWVDDADISAAYDLANGATEPMTATAKMFKMDGDNETLFIAATIMVLGGITYYLISKK